MMLLIVILTLHICSGLSGIFAELPAIRLSSRANYAYNYLVLEKHNSKCWIEHKLRGLNGRPAPDGERSQTWTEISRLIDCFK